jgi:hypothetical protein
VTIPDTVTSIGDSAFSDCSGLTSLTIPKSVTSIGSLAFADCFGLTSLTIPATVTSTGDGAFQDCYGLTSLTISDGVTSIGEDEFYGCYRLASVTIPPSVVTIGDGAFEFCRSLTSATFEGNAPPNFGAAVFYGDGISIVGTALGFSIDYYSFNAGWSTPTWTSPSGDTYNAQPVFGAGTVKCTVSAGVAQLIPVSDLLAQVSGGPATLVGVGADGHKPVSADGATLSFNSGFVLYPASTPAGATSDSFQYTVQDANGDTAMGTVLITITYGGVVGQQATIVNVGTTVTVNFFGVPGDKYTPERSTDLVNWMPFGNVLTAPANGLMQVVDYFFDVHGARPPPAAYYRLLYTP